MLVVLESKPGPEPGALNIPYPSALNPTLDLPESESPDPVRDPGSIIHGSRGFEDVFLVEVL